MMTPPPTATRVACRHCQRAKVNRPRGLCWSCYHKPGVRELYPSTSKYARRGIGNITGTQPLPTFATVATPGSEEKIAILAERARLKQSLWHPDDERLTGECNHIKRKLVDAFGKEKRSGFRRHYRKPILDKE